MKRLLFSILSLSIIAVIAIGVTRAYFTDTEVLGENVIHSGVVDIDPRGPVATPFTLTNVMPGVWTPYERLDVYNLSTSAPVKYRFYDQFVSQSLSGMYNKINVRVVHTHSTSGEDPATWPEVYNGPLKDLLFLSYNSISGPAGILGTNITHRFYFQFQLDPSTGNQYQNQSATFNLIVDATQPENPLW